MSGGPSMWCVKLLAGSRCSPSIGVGYENQVKSFLILPSESFHRTFLLMSFEEKGGSKDQVLQTL